MQHTVHAALNLHVTCGINPLLMGNQPVNHVLVSVLLYILCPALTNPFGLCPTVTSSFSPCPTIASPFRMKV